MCVYAFSISEELMGAPIEDPAVCHFRVMSDDHSSVVKSSFVDIPCEEMSNYHCSASWSEDSGYMIFTVDNTQDSRRAYFGFKDTELEAGQLSDSHRSPSYVVVPTSDTAIVMPPNIHPRHIARPHVDRKGAITEATMPVIVSEDQFDTTASDLTSTVAMPEEGSEDDTITAVVDSDDFDGTDDSALHLDILPDLDDGTDDSLAMVAPQEGDDSLDSIVAPVVDDQFGDDSSVLGNFIQETSEGRPVVYGSVVLTSDTQQLATSPTIGDDQDDSQVLASLPSLPPTIDVHDPSVPAYPSTWGMRNITRDISYKPNSVNMGFYIDVYPDGPSSIPCHLTIDLDDNLDPLFASWFTKKCNDSSWYLSWGYNQMTDSAVATLINPDRTEEAWFGWDFVNAQLPDINLASAGPGIVQTCDC